MRWAWRRMSADRFAPFFRADVGILGKLVEVA
jgi:hypothetical protein